MKGLAGYAETARAYAADATRLREAWATIDLDKWLAPVASQLHGPSILDVGAGTGRLAHALSQRARVTAVEPVAELWSVPLPRIDDTLPLLRQMRGHYDRVLCLGVFHHLTPRDQQRALRRLAMLTKPGGRIILSVRHGRGNAQAQPSRAAALTAPGLRRRLLRRRSALQPGNQRAGVRFTWLVFDKLPRS